MAPRTETPSRRVGTDGSTLPHLPALDGLRAAALLGVLGYHLGLTWLQGGYLPLGLFFVLSGFLITSLLLHEHRRDGRIDLRAFWGRRSRRLAPASVFAVVVIVVLGGSVVTTRVGMVGDVGAALGWWTNWRLIATSQTYTNSFQGASPFQHLWSLAVEEQCYLVLPLVAMVLLRLGRGRAWLLGAAAGVGALATALWSAWLHVPGQSPLRAYYGTDVRAGEVLVGVALACVTRGGARLTAGPTRRWLDAAAVVALTLVLASWTLTHGFADWLFNGGLLGLAVLAAVVVAACVQPGGWLTRIWSARALVWLGQRSYGTYLLHWPIYRWLGVGEPGHGWVTSVAALSASVVAGHVSFTLLEQPIRRRRLGATVGGLAWANALVAAVAVITVTVVHHEVPAAEKTSFVEPGSAFGPKVDVVADQPSTTDGVDSTPHDAGTPTTGAPEPVPSTAPTTVTGAPPPTARPAPTQEPTTSSHRPPHVLVVGDSLGSNIGAALGRVATTTGAISVQVQADGGCYLLLGGTRYDGAGQAMPPREACERWPTEWPRLVRTYRPDVVLISTGINDIADYVHPSYAGRQHVGQPGVDAILGRSYGEAVKMIHAHGARTVWLVPPCFSTRVHTKLGDDNVVNPRLQALRATHLRGVLDTRPAVALADLDRLVCPGDQYSDMPMGVPGGRPDGLHFTNEAADRIVEQWLVPILLGQAPPTPSTPTPQPGAQLSL